MTARVDAVSHVDQPYRGRKTAAWGIAAITTLVGVGCIGAGIEGCICRCTGGLADGDPS